MKLRSFIKSLLSEAARTRAAQYLESNSLHIAQAGQDYWVAGEVFNEREGGWFVDIGAHDGVYISNTYLLEKRYGWTGICVEANPENFVRLRMHRSAVCVQACVNAKEGKAEFAKDGAFSGMVDTGTSAPLGTEVISVSTRTLTSILDEYRAPAQMDYLSVDVEGAEERVFAGFDFDRYAFKCLTVERPPDPLRKVLLERGYVLVREVPSLDAFYIHESFREEYQSNLLCFYKKRRFSWRWR